MRGLFTREAMLESEWYAARLVAKVRFDRALWERHVADLTEFCEKRARLQGSERAEV